jgi:hypothetical protein
VKQRREELPGMCCAEVVPACTEVGEVTKLKVGNLEVSGLSNDWQVGLEIHAQYCVLGL